MLELYSFCDLSRLIAWIREKPQSLVNHCLFGACVPLPRHPNKPLRRYLKTPTNMSKTPNFKRSDWMFKGLTMTGEISIDFDLVDIQLNL